MAETYPTAYEYAQSGTYALPTDPSDIHAYVVSVDRNTKNINAEKLKALQIIGMFIEAGYLYDVAHVEQDTYVSPKLDSQVNLAKKNNIAYGMYAVVRSRTTQEAAEELKWLRIYIQKYVPTLGCWLKLELSNSTATNDQIIAKYKDILERSGLKGKIGFYVTRKQLSKITWSKWQNDFLLWLVDPVDNISEIDQILTPRFFDFLFVLTASASTMFSHTAICSYM
jgi:hypothetical protein